MGGYLGRRPQPALPRQSPAPPRSNIHCKRLWVPHRLCRSLGLRPHQQGHVDWCQSRNLSLRPQHQESNLSTACPYRQEHTRMHRFHHRQRREAVDGVHGRGVYHWPALTYIRLTGQSFRLSLLKIQAGCSYFRSDRENHLYLRDQWRHLMVREQRLRHLQTNRWHQRKGKIHCLHYCPRASKQLCGRHPWRQQRLPVDGHQQRSVPIYKIRRTIHQLYPARRTCKYPILLERRLPLYPRQTILRHCGRSGEHRVWHTRHSVTACASTIHQINCRQWGSATW